MAIIALSSFQIYPAVNGGYNPDDLEVRWWYNRGYIDSTTVFVQGGNGQSGFYISSACTVDGDGIITVPSTDIFSTLDAIDPSPQSIQIFGRLYSNNTPKQYVTAFSSTPTGWVVQSPDPAVLTYEDLVLENQSIVLANPPQTFPTFAQMIAYIDSLVPTPLASDVVIGRTELSVAPINALTPIAVGNNDPRTIDVSSYASFAAAVSGISSTPTTFNISTNLSVTDDLTVPSTFTCRIIQGGGFTVTTGKTFTLNGFVEADPSQKIFYNALSGQGTIELNASGQTAYPNWWVANSSPATTDMAAGIRAAAASGVSVLEFLDEVYRLNSSVSYDRGSLEFRGRQGAYIYFAPTTHTISAATNAATVTLTSASHGLTTGDSIAIFNPPSGWSSMLGIWAVTVLTSSTFTIALDSSGFGAYGGGAVFVETSGVLEASGDENQSDVTFRNLTFSGSGYWRGPSTSILYLAPADIAWAGNTVAGYPAVDTLVYTTTRQRFLIENCNFIGPGREAIAFCNTSVTINNVTVTDGLNAGNNGSIWVRNAERVHIDNCTLIGCTYKNINTAFIDGVTVSNIIIKDPTGGADGVGVYFGHFNVNSVLTNYTFDGAFGTPYEQFIKVSYNATNTAISNCTLSGPSYVFFQGVQGATFTGSRITSNGTTVIRLLYHDDILPLLSPTNVFIDGVDVYSTEDGSVGEPKIVDLSYGINAHFSGRVFGNVYANPAGNVQIVHSTIEYNSPYATPERAIYLQDFRQIFNLTGATNATPIVITSVGHGLSTGDSATVSSVTGNTAANGTWTITRVDADRFSLDTSVGNGAYTGGGNIIAARGIAIIDDCHVDNKVDEATIYCQGSGHPVNLHITNNTVSANGSGTSIPVTVSPATSGQFLYANNTMYGTRLTLDAMVGYTDTSQVRVLGSPQELTSSGAVFSNIAWLAHAAVPIAATLRAPSPGDTILIVDTSSSGTAAHTVTVPVGVTWDGTHRVATFNAPGEALYAEAISASRWLVMYTLGSVVFS